MTEKLIETHRNSVCGLNMTQSLSWPMSPSISQFLAPWLRRSLAWPSRNFASKIQGESDMMKIYGHFMYFLCSVVMFNIYSSKSNLSWDTNLTHIDIDMALKHLESVLHVCRTL